jgi:hypothetical protein
LCSVQIVVLGPAIASVEGLAAKVHGIHRSNHVNVNDVKKGHVAR